MKQLKLVHVMSKNLFSNLYLIEMIITWSTAYSLGIIFFLTLIRHQYADSLPDLALSCSDADLQKIIKLTVYLYTFCKIDCIFTLLILQKLFTNFNTWPLPIIINHTNYQIFQEFFEENFDVDSFLALNRKSFTLESLKKDLENYSTTIQNSLVELINR